MEWLQTYKIGDELLKTGKFKPLDAYFGHYFPSLISKTRQIKSPYILDIIIDIKTRAIVFELRAFGDSFSNDKLFNESISKEFYFTSVAGNFTSYYLCSSYGKEKSVLDFFNIKEGKIFKKVKNQEIGFDSELSKLIKIGLLTESYRNSRFLDIRTKIMSDEVIVSQIDKAISDLSLYIDIAKIKAYDKELLKGERIPKPLTSRLNFSINEIALVVLKVIDKDEVIYLNREPELIDFYYARFLSLANINYNNNKNGVCYFNGEDKIFDVSLPRDNINVLKVNTNSPTTQSNFSGENFLLSKDSYEKLKLGGWFISKKLVVKIAGVKHYILPDFNSDFKILNYKAELTEKVDIAFNLTDYKRMQQRLYRLSNNCLNSISFLGFWGDDRQIDIVNRIQLVNPDYFNEVFDVFEEVRDRIAELASTEKNDFFRFTLASSYLLIPVSSNTPKKNASLEFFKMLLEKISIPNNFLMENYIKLIKLYKYGKEDGKTKKIVGTVNIPFQDPAYFDSSVSKATIRYVIIINLINRIFNNQDTMEKDTSTLNKTEKFFRASGLDNSESKKALFYLGRLIQRVAIAQRSQGNSKAILNKINYSGMTVSDIQWLANEVFEKLKQYNRGKYPALDYGENDWTLFSEHFCIANSDGQNSWNLSEAENIFYLFVGYGMFWQTVDVKEKKVVNEPIEEISDNENIIIDNEE